MHIFRIIFLSDFYYFFLLNNIKAMKTQKQAQQPRLQIIIEVPPQQQKVSTSSKQQEEYDQVMSSCHRRIAQSMDSIKRQLINEGIYYDEQLQFVRQIKLVLRRSSINKEAVIVNCRWGYFSLDCWILNIGQENFKHGISIDNGNFGNIYKGTFSNIKIALKCVPIRDNKQRKNIIKQWFILRIASALKIGPKIYQCFGFDLIMYSQCIQFSMEVCQNPYKSIFNNQALYWDLALLHKFHIVHLDIKPDNIMLSPFYRKAVFVDFGLSRIIKNNIGQKTLTNFTGTVNFCSQQMAQCSFKNAPQFVDLYYNDFYGLKITNRNINESRIGINSQTVDFFLDLILIPEADLSYFSLYIIKYDLFFNHIEKCIADWIINNNYMKKYLIQSLLFLLEIVPTSQLKRYLSYFYNQIQLESTLVSKIKIIYETRIQKFYIIDFLIDEDKVKKFEQYLSSFWTTRVKPQSINFKSQQTFNQLLIPKKIQRSQFKQYIQQYLNQISYVNNYQNRTASQRQQIAKIFYRIFISKQIPSQLYGRKLIEQTIKYLVNWCLNSHKQIQDKHYFVLIIFKLVDFITIMDIGTCEEVLQWLNNIMQNLMFTLYYKHFFLIKISQMNYLNYFRITKKKEISRFQFIKILEKWIIQEKVKIKPLKIFSGSQQLDGQILQTNLSIPVEFMYQFGEDLFQYTRVRYNSSQTQLLDKYLVLLNKKAIKQFKCFQYILLQIFQLFYFGYFDFKICQRIYKVIKKNIADEEIQGELIFKIYIKYSNILQLFLSKKLQSIQFVKLNNDLQKIGSEQLFLFKSFLLEIGQKKSEFNMICQLNNNQTLLFSSQQSYLKRLLNAYVPDLLLRFKKTGSNQILKNINKINGYKKHNLEEPLEIFFILKLNNLMKQKIADIQNLLTNPQTSKKINCRHCKEVLRLNIILYEIQTKIRYFYDNVICNQSQEAFNKKCKQIFQHIQKLKDYDKSEDVENNIIFFKIIQYGLRMGAYICFRFPQMEITYHGIINHFELLKKCNKINLYFQVINKSHHLIKAIIQILYTSNFTQLLYFIYNIVIQTQKSHIIDHQRLVIYYITDILIRLDCKQTEQLFFQLRELQSTKGTQGKALVIVYALIFNSQVMKKYQGKLLKIINNNIKFIMQRSQIQIGLSMLSIIRDKMINEGIIFRKQRLQFNYVNNKLLKMLIVNGATDEPLAKPRCFRGKIKCLKQKISKIGKCTKIINLSFQTNLK